MMVDNQKIKKVGDETPQYYEKTLHNNLKTKLFNNVSILFL